MTIRTEQTLRDMWEAGLNRHAEAAADRTEGNRCTDSAEAHDRAAAAEAQAAAADRKGAKGLLDRAEGRANEAADLFDIVNEKRTAMGLAPLTPGEPYPEDPAAGQPQAGAGETRTDPLPPGVVPVDAGEAGQA